MTAAVPEASGLWSMPTSAADLEEAVAKAVSERAPELIAIAAVSDETTEPSETSTLEALSVLIPEGTTLCHTRTPALQGSRTTGYDRQLVSILRALWEDERVSRGEGGSKGAPINFVVGIDGAAGGNCRELRRILNIMQADYTLLGENAGTSRRDRDMSHATPLARAKQAADAAACVALQAFSTPETLSYMSQRGQEIVPLHYPVGVGATDGLLIAVSRLTGNAIPDSLEQERGRLLDAIADASAHLHGKSFAVTGEPDFCLGMTLFLLELGVEPKHVLSPTGGTAWKDALTTLLRFAPTGQDCRVYPGKDLGFLRLRLLTDPVDFVIGDSGCQFLERDTGTPLVQFSASASQPWRDRHAGHWGYQGGLNILSKLLDRSFADIDRFSIVPSKTDYSFDIIR